MHICFFSLRINSVKFLFHPRTCKSSNWQYLSLTSCKYSRTMSSWQHTNFAPDRTNVMRFSSVSSNAFVQNHCTHNVFFSVFKFFCNEVNTSFFHNFFAVIIIRKSIDFFFNKFFSFFKFFLSVSSVKVVVSIKNHIMSCFFNNLFDFSCIVRVYKFFFFNTTFFCKCYLSFTLFFDFNLRKFNSVHNVVFCNEFTASFNHDNWIVSTCNNDIKIWFISLLVCWVSD